ncbi:hypothetical protein EJP82_00960 [Paenibacillus anaericanus]|uniref:Uncharacterized protein n=1 Tax=Paenibacillus anaericanus TaxID=170367 RepID=A0A433YFB3_9BACL|nr:hypothetical protein [Paenibacillus anaericanus]RUT48545.1 hypothetical protein EJP82_00960 [Paenibacillus anaericanus]
MGKKNKKKEPPKFEIVVIPVEGDPIEAISNALEPNIRSVLAKHGAYLKIPLYDYLRNHAKV